MHMYPLHGPIELKIFRSQSGRSPQLVTNLASIDVSKHEA